MRQLLLYISFLSFISPLIINAQGNLSLKAGENAPTLILQTKNNKPDTFQFPYQNKLILIHFWSSSVNRSVKSMSYLNYVYDNYYKKVFKDIAGFEILTVAIQSDKSDWEKDLKLFDSDKFINCMARRGYEDSCIQQYKINQQPASFLIDNNGKIILVNPKVFEIEKMLDGYLAEPAYTKDIKGTLLYTENIKDAIKNHPIYLIDRFTDTISRSTTDHNGNFCFENIKPPFTYTLNVDTGLTLTSRSKTAVAIRFNLNYFAVIPKNNGYFNCRLNLTDTPVFVNTKTPAKKTETTYIFLSDIKFAHHLGKIDTLSHPELDRIAGFLKYNKKYKLEIISCVSDMMEDKLHDICLASLKDYLVKSSIKPSRIKIIRQTVAFSGGRSEAENNCLTLKMRR